MNPKKLNSRDNVSHSSSAGKLRGIQAIVIGGSAGGMDALKVILRDIPAEFPAPIMVANHLHKSDRGYLAEHLDLSTELDVLEAVDKLRPEPGHVYIAPSNYHLLIEHDGHLALSIDPRVNYARPSIDVLFESAARVWRNNLIGILLSGANSDGAFGMKTIRRCGGIIIVQSPETAFCDVMPRSAITMTTVDFVLSPEEIGSLLKNIDAHIDNAHGTSPNRRLCTDAR